MQSLTPAQHEGRAWFFCMEECVAGAVRKDIRGVV